MLKRLNIKSILQANTSLSKDHFKKFIAYYGIETREAEIDDLESLVDVLEKNDCPTGSLDRFYVGYKIPQIGKEFDLLRFGPNSILNIEIKSKCSEEKAKKQLLRNKYYLSFIGRKIHAFTYISESDNILYLDEDDELKKVTAAFLVSILRSQSISDNELPDSLFDPSDFLVSPFNSTKRFLAAQYFLTNQQEDIKNQIVDLIKKSSSAIFISIVGNAGTGKTLLTYDIARQAIDEGGKPLIIHCGILNRGHLKLIEKGWEIAPIKSYSKYNISDYDFVILDEAQRIYLNQLDDIVQKAKAFNKFCIFSHDKLQTLGKAEERNDASARISALAPLKEYKLSEKIRTNREIASFIKMLFNNKRSVKISNNGNIEINYFSTNKSAKDYLDALDGRVWEVLRFTPSQYNKEHHEEYSDDSLKTAHEVIGQEFDGVAVVIDRFFSYDQDGNLTYGGSVHYRASKMLFQNITRSRKRLNVVVIGNEKLLNRCIEILG
jgi:hypothetical protein